MDPKNICILEPKLNSYMGHMFNYDHSVCEGARSLGLKVRVLGGKVYMPEIAAALPFEPVFDVAFQPVETGSRVLNFFLKPLHANWAIYKEFCSIDRESLTPDWLVFLGEVSIFNLPAFALWVRKFRPANAPVFVLCLRLNYCYEKKYKAGFWLFPAMRLLERLSARYRIRLVTDSDRLSAAYGKFTRLPVAVLPIPHTSSAFTPAQPGPSGIEVLSLGSARHNKGFDLFANAIKSLHERRALAGLRFTLQCYVLPDPCHQMGPLVEMLKELKLPDLKLVEGMVDEKRYWELICAAGALVFPYRISEYVGNTSGIFTEALAAGKPVIVTAGTWMEDQLKRFGAGVTFRDGDAGDLARAILELRDNYPRLAAQAEQRRAAWTAYHNPDNFLRELFKTAGSAR
jgi:glycosyltransferase involved in cell wall biosynthesis